MATYCPCGCGKKLGFSEARYLKIMDERIEFFDEFNKSGIPTGDDLANGQAFVAEGKELRDGLIEVFHGADARTVDRHQLRAWIKYADKTRRKFVRALKEADLI